VWDRRAARGWLPLALATAALLVATGCNVDKQIDTDRAASDIKRTLSAESAGNVRSVRCPDKVAAEKGARFRCVATASDGSRIRIVVTQTNSDGGVRWRIAR
jgi:Domain of unknown function (DUF4333)